MKIVLVIIMILLVKSAHSYPQFIGFGYTSCLTCHYNPLGNGPLTDYGRAVSATAISDRIWNSHKTSEEEIANRAGFLFNKWDKNKYVRPSLNYRQLYLTRKAGSENEQKEKILMVLSGSVVLKTPDDKTYVVVEAGYSPAAEGEDSNYRSREHYIGHRISSRWGLYAGLMDKAFGIRVDDHTAYSRSTNGLAQNDQSHGVIAHYVNEKFEAAFNYFLGNLEQDSRVRQVGESVTMEYSLFPMTRVGGSFLTSSSEVIKDTLYELHTRIGFGKGSSVMLEVGRKKRQPLAKGLDAIESSYLFMQNQISLRRGLFFNYSFEWYVPDLREEQKSLRLGPGIQWLPGQRVEFRLDFYNSRAFNPHGVSEDTWDIAGQVHLWF